MNFLSQTQRNLKLTLISKLVTLDSDNMIQPKSGVTIARFISDGYRKIRIAGISYQEHNVIYALFYKEWPVELVDHRDGNRSNNSIANLRACSYSENCCNRSMRSDNTLGYKGVFKREQKGGTVYGWMIKWQGHNISKSGFKTPKEANAAREIHLKLAHGDFANNGRKST